MLKATQASCYEVILKKQKIGSSDPVSSYVRAHAPVLHCSCVSHVHLLLVFDQISRHSDHSQTARTNAVSPKLQCSRCGGYCLRGGLLTEVVNRGYTVNFKMYIFSGSNNVRSAIIASGSATSAMFFL